MKYTIRFGTYFGIPVRIHFTFPLILVAFGVAAGVKGGAWEAVRSVALILCVFVCVVLHEFGHSLVARRYGVTVRDIVLLPIGGMARAERIPEKPIQEIVVAIAGPLVNFVLVAIIGGALWLRGVSVTTSDAFLVNIFWVNVVLGVFNLVPAFPMDGGRILRGLMAMKMPYLKATRYAKNIGQIVAIGFAIIGFIDPTFIMLPLIAIFIFFGATSEERIVRVKASLDGMSTRDFLPTGVPMLTTDDTVGSIAPGLASYGAFAFPVTNEERTLAGAVESEDLRRAIESGRLEESLRRFVRTGFPLIEASAPASQAYYLLQSHKLPVAGVVENNGFLGLVYFDDLAHAIA